jgi:hypothetical protein
MFRGFKDQDTRLLSPQRSSPPLSARHRDYNPCMRRCMSRGKAGRSEGRPCASAGHTLLSSRSRAHPARFGSAFLSHVHAIDDHWVVNEILRFHVHCLCSGHYRSYKGTVNGTRWQMASVGYVSVSKNGRGEVKPEEARLRLVVHS